MSTDLVPLRDRESQFRISLQQRQCTVLSRSRSHYGSNETLLVHSIRNSIVCVTTTRLQELDASSGMLLGSMEYDLSVSIYLASNSVELKQTDQELIGLNAVGTRFVVAVYQEHFLAVWDLEEMTFVAILEIEKSQKHISALTGSLCASKMIFYAVEASHSVRVVSLDCIETIRKVSCKGTSRTSYPKSLDYFTSKRLLCVGYSDGLIQIFSVPLELVTASDKNCPNAASLIFTAHSLTSPIVSISFGLATAKSKNAKPNLPYFATAYQNRTIEIWKATDIANLTTGTGKEPQRVASLQMMDSLSSPSSDFSDRNGFIEFCWHQNDPILLVQWKPSNSLTPERFAIWNFQQSSLSKSYQILSNQSAINDSHELATLEVNSTSNGKENEVGTFYWNEFRFHRLSSGVGAKNIRCFDIKAEQDDDTCEAIDIPPTLVMQIELHLEHYLSCRKVPKSTFYITKCVESGFEEYLINRYMLPTGGTEQLTTFIPDRMCSVKGLLPRRIVCNAEMTTLCITLASNDIQERDLSHSDTSNMHYMLYSMESGGNAVDTTFGPIIAARQTSFIEPGDARDIFSKWSFVLLVLSSSGVTINLQHQFEDVDPAYCMSLTYEVERFYLSPIKTENEHSWLNSRILCQTRNVSNSTCTLVYESAGPKTCTSSRSICWSTKKSEEIRDVVWNKSHLEGNVGNQKLLCAIETTFRFVVISEDLVALQEYSIIAPKLQSFVWIAQSLVYLTSDGQLRYFTPAILPTSDKASHESHLICSLTVDQGEIIDFSARSYLQIVAALPDRIVYAKTDSRTLQCELIMRPWSAVEILASGYEHSNPVLQAIIEQNAISFLIGMHYNLVNPFTNTLIQVLFYRFSWTANLQRILQMLLNPAELMKAQNFMASKIQANNDVHSSSNVTSCAKLHLHCHILACMLLAFEEWDLLLAQFMRHEVALEEYALQSSTEVYASSSLAKLPSRSSLLSHHFKRLGDFFLQIGRLHLAFKCYDIAGCDKSMFKVIVLLIYFKVCNASSAKSSALRSLLLDQSMLEWDKIQSKTSLWSLMNTIKLGCNEAKDSTNDLRNEAFAQLRCDKPYHEQERRTRLLLLPVQLDEGNPVIVTHQDAITLTSVEDDDTENQIWSWKRIQIEDYGDWIGTATIGKKDEDEVQHSGDVKVCTEIPRRANYTFLCKSNVPHLEAEIGISKGMMTGFQDREENDLARQAKIQNTKVTIGPFIDDEDAAIAYWRFEEGNNASLMKASASEEAILDSLDSSKYENNLQIQNFGGLFDETRECLKHCVTVFPSSSPVDKGEDGRIMEAYALRFPMEVPNRAEKYGAKCLIPTGSTLDLGATFDDDPYRRKLTVEMWIRNYHLHSRMSNHIHSDDLQLAQDVTLPISDSSKPLDIATRSLIGRSLDSDSTYWELSLTNGYVRLQFFAQTLLSKILLLDAAKWHHIAFTVDVLSPDEVISKLYVQGELVGSKTFVLDHVSEKIVSDSMQSNGSILWIGKELTDYEVTEVRIWAAVRTLEQIQDMRENYLGIAELKKKLKVTIHKRNCQCDKCTGYRLRKSAVSMVSPIGSGSSTLISASVTSGIKPIFPSTPPASKARERRRPPQNPSIIHQAVL